MHNYLSVIKLQFKNMFRRDKSKKSKPAAIVAMFIGLFLLWAMIAGMCVMLVVLLGGVFEMMYLESEFISIIFMVGMGVELFFGIGVVLSCLYFSKDTEFFMSLPIKPVTVFAAKFTVVYLTELAVSALLMLPALIAAGITMYMSWQFYVLLPFAILFTPIIPLLLSAIISIPVMYIASFLRNRGAVGSIAVLVLFGLFFGGYYFLISKTQNLNPDELDLTAMIGTYRNIARSVYPMYALARAMAGTSVFGLGVGASTAVNLVIAFGSVAAMIAVASLISAAVYKRGAAGMLENAKRNKAVKADYRSSSACKALMKKEWREILRTPTFAMNCLLGIIITPIVMVFIIYSFKSSMSNAIANGAEMNADVFNTVVNYVLLAMLAFIGVGTNSAPSTAISREGEKFYYFKILPIDYKTQIRAKTYVSIAISAVSCFLGCLVALIGLKDVVFFICAFVYLMLLNYASVHFCMWLDVGHPKLKWTMPNEAVKHNRNAIISVFVNMLAGIVFAFAGGILYVVCLYSLGSVAAANAISWGVVIVLSAVCAVLSHLLLYRTCERKLDAIES